MSAASLARTAVRIEVALLRPPLLLADRVAARAGVAPVRSTVRQGLAVLDALAAAVAPSVQTASKSAPASQADEARADDEVVEQIAEELLEEQELAPRAGELAEDDELRRVQAELNAKRLVEEQQEHRPD